MDCTRIRRSVLVKGFTNGFIFNTIRFFLAGFLILHLCNISEAAFGPEFNSSEWKRYRDLRFPAEVRKGTVAVPIDFTIMEKSKSDLSDLRIVTSEGSVVPATIKKYELNEDASSTFPGKVVKVTRNQGKWTDILVDKGSKSLSSGMIIRTGSKDFLRNVEIRGSDNARDAYIIKMDGLIMDIEGTGPVVSLDISHPLNNFQYIHARILDEDQHQLKIDGVTLVNNPIGKKEPSFSDVRILERKESRNPDLNIVTGDLGEKLFPVSCVKLSIQNPTFRKKMTVYGAASPLMEAWEKIAEGTVFRIKKQEAMKENTEIRFKPKAFRFMKIELSGSNGGVLTINRVGVIPESAYLVFSYNPGTSYRLYYDNPNAGSQYAEAIFESRDQELIASVSANAVLGEEQKTNVQLRPVALTKQPEQKPGKARNKTAYNTYLIPAACISLGVIALILYLIARMRRNRRKYRSRFIRSIN